MNLGENIYRLRGEKNMSQGDLADALEVSRQSVSKWENNSATPELDKLIKMSQLFDVSLDELVGKASPQQSPTPIAPSEAKPSFPPRKIVGALLLCAAFLTFLLITALGRLEEAIFLALPFALCGAACFAFRRHTGLWCAWILYVLISFFGVQIARQAILSTGSWSHFLFVQLPLLSYTVAQFHRLNLHFQKIHKLLLGIGWLLWLAGLGLYFYDAMTVGWIWSPWVYITHFLLLALLATLSYHLLPQKWKAPA